MSSLRTAAQASSSSSQIAASGPSRYSQPSSQAERERRRNNILNAVRAFNGQGDPPANPPSAPSSPTSSEFVTAFGSMPSSPSSDRAPTLLSALDLHLPIPSQASDAGSSYTVHGDLSLDGLSEASARTPVYANVALYGSMMTPPGTGKTQIVFLPDVDGGLPRDQGRAVTPTEEDYDALQYATQPESSSSTTLRGSQDSRGSTLVPEPKELDFNALFTDLALLPAYVRRLQDENERLREELEQEKEMRFTAQRALRDALSGL